MGKIESVENFSRTDDVDYEPKEVEETPIVAEYQLSTNVFGKEKLRRLK